ncbi:hypothetical protein D6817_05580, partial [Candidatus Pacearchaeota archaeon]
MCAIYDSQYNAGSLSCTGTCQIDTSDCRSYEGFGAVTTGGAGGEVYHVTSLADSGPGTLRDAVSQPNRYIVFDVAGDIVLNSDITIQSSNLTIDGMSAPSPGITIKKSSVTNGEFKVYGIDNFIITGLRFVGHYTGPGHPSTNGDNFVIFGDTPPNGEARNIVIDHVAFVNSTDGSPDLRGNITNLTLSWSLVYGNWHPTSISFDCSNNDIPCRDIQYRNGISLHHNVYAKNGERNPQVRSNTSVIDIVNNVIYSYQSYTGSSYGMRIRNGDISAKANANIVNNYFEPGSTGSPNSALEYGTSPSPSDDNGPGDAARCNDPSNPVTNSLMGQLYVTGNILPPETVDCYSTVSQRLPAPSVTTYQASELCSQVVPNVGMQYKTQAEIDLINEIQQALGCGASGAICGNNIVEQGEVCDGNTQACTTADGYAGTQQCNAQCNGFGECVTTEYCGDSIVNGNEQCDDGNTQDGDGCSSICTTTTCSGAGGFECSAGEFCPGNSVAAADTNACCDVSCEVVSGESCSQCGEGLFNICDRNECESISEGCYYFDDQPLFDFGGQCNSCSLISSCEEYSTDRLSCNSNVCGLANCVWNEAEGRCVTSTCGNGVIDEGEE